MDDKTKERMKKEKQIGIERIFKKGKRKRKLECPLDKIKKIKGRVQIKFPASQGSRLKTHDMHRNHESWRRWRRIRSQRIWTHFTVQFGGRERVKTHPCDACTTGLIPPFLDVANTQSQGMELTAFCLWTKQVVQPLCILLRFSMVEEHPFWCYS